MFPLGQYPVRNVTGVHCSAEREDEHMARSGLAESFGADIHRGAGGKDVIDQQDVSAGDRLGMWDGEGSAKIVQPLLP